MIYTTNAIESLNFQLRKVTKAKGHFPSDEAATKVLYLAMRNAEKKWRIAARFWNSAPISAIAPSPCAKTITTHGGAATKS